MIEFKITLFISTIITVHYIFKYINDIGDKKVVKMKEFIDFIDYLRIYSCDMKMPLEEILLKYNFKSVEIKNICHGFSVEIRNNAINRGNKDSFLSFIEQTVMTPIDFNCAFVDIINYYGSTYSEILNKKLIFTNEELIRIMEEYQNIHKEKKILYNKISLLFGCLVAVILI